jgi:DNA-binding transcriptional LysR family regulator
MFIPWSSSGKLSAQLYAESIASFASIDAKCTIMNFRFDLPDLQAFTAVARLGSFRAAAQSLHLSQPALSRRIDKLEEALGLKLLERTTRRVSLSNTGREFARKAQQLLDELDTTILGLEDLAAQRSGIVTVACVPSATRYFLPQVLMRFHAQYPRIRVRIHDAHGNEVLRAVLEGEADFGLNFLGQNEPRLSFSPLLSERFVLACRKDHPLAKRRSVKWSQLGAYPYLSVGSSSGNRSLIERALAGQKDRPQPIFESRHVQTLLGLVEAGLGVAAVPLLAMPARAGDLVGIPLVAPVVQRELGLILRRGHQASPVAQKLMGFMAALKNQSKT